MPDEKAASVRRTGRRMPDDAFVYWHGNHYRVEFKWREVARFTASEREQAEAFTFGFNAGLAQHAG